jgi:hypothetical protein
LISLFGNVRLGAPLSKLKSLCGEPISHISVNWLPHYQLLTSLSFRLESQPRDTHEHWLQTRELFTIAIRSLPHLQELHLNLPDLDDGEIPPLVIASSSLGKLEISLNDQLILDVPSLTDLDVSWMMGDIPSTQEMMEAFVNCKNVTHLTLYDQIDATMVIPWHIFSPNMISIKLRDSAQLSIDQYIQILRCPQFATLETFHCMTQGAWSHLLFDAILHQWKYLKELEVRHWRERRVGFVVDPLDEVVTAQLISFIPIDSTSSITTNNNDDKKGSLSSLSLGPSSSSAGQYTSSPGKGQRWVHHSLEKLYTNNKYHIKHWRLPALRHFTIITHYGVDDNPFLEVEMIWSFISQSYERLHTLQVLPCQPDDEFNDRDMEKKIDERTGRAQLKRITFPNLEKLVITGGYLEWLYECIDAGPYLSYIQINSLGVDTCEELLNSETPMINLIISPLTHPNEWHHYQPIHLYLLDSFIMADSKEQVHLLIVRLLKQFTNIASLQIHCHESIIDRRVVEAIPSLLPTRSIRLLFAV